MSNYKWSEAFERLPIGTTLRRKSNGRLMKKVDHHNVLPPGDHKPTLFKYMIGPLQTLEEVFNVPAEGNTLPPAEPQTSDNPRRRSSAVGPAVVKKSLGTKLESCPKTPQ